MENGGHPVQRAPAPWTLKAESYLLFLRLKEVPLGLYDALEETWEDEALGRFEGGLGAVMIVRYTDTPVGRSSLLHLNLPYMSYHDLHFNILCSALSTSKSSFKSKPLSAAASLPH